MIELRRATVSSGIVLAVITTVLVGCSGPARTVGDPAQDPDAVVSPTAVPAASPADSVGPLAASAGFPILPLAGDFVSQAAQTSGVVTITASSDDVTTITLSEFSTAPGADLRLNLNTGPLEVDPAGVSTVNGGVQFQFEGAVAADESSQSFEYSNIGGGVGAFRSVTVYDYATREARGSAALAPFD